MLSRCARNPARPQADADDTEQFESTDSGASGTFPMQAGLVRKGGHMVIKGRPCKVIDVSTSKTGKHGHAKCHFVAQDIFTGKKMEDLVPSSHNLAAPNVTRMEYQVRRALCGWSRFCSGSTCSTWGHASSLRSGRPGRFAGSHALLLACACAHRRADH